MSIKINKTLLDKENNYINEIKYLRWYLEERYGVTGGLKEAKDLIDSIYRLQEITSKDNKILSAIASLREELTPEGYLRFVAIYTERRNHEN